MFVHLRISKTMYSNVTKFSVLVNCGRGLVLLWQQCSILCTSGFVDDVMFAHNRQGKSDANTACVSPGGAAWIGYCSCLWHMLKVCHRWQHQAWSLLSMTALFIIAGCTCRILLGFHSSVVSSRDIDGAYVYALSDCINNVGDYVQICCYCKHSSVQHLKL